MVELEEKGRKEVEDFLKGELNDYALKFKDIVCTEEYPDDTFYYSVTIFDYQKEKEVTFKYEDEELYVEVTEDICEKVCSYDYTAKYFWMTIFEW